MRVAIIGGGWSGLAAGAELARQRIPLTLFEAAPSLGGRARTLARDGFVIDNGQHILSGAYSATLRLMRLVGVDVEQAMQRMPMSLVYPGQFRLHAPRLPAPLHLAGALLAAQGLRWPDRIAALRLMRELRRRAYSLPAEQSVSELLDAAAATPTTRRLLWEPLCIAALNTPPSEASARVFAAVLRDSLAAKRAASDLLLPRIDLGRLFPDAAAIYIAARGGDVLLGRAVGSIVPALPKFRLAPLPDAEFSHVILAVAPQQLSRLVAGLPELAAGVELVDRFEYQPIITCYLAYAAQVRLPAPMVGMTGTLVQWLFDRGQLGAQPGLLAAVVSAARQQLGMAREELAARIHAEVESLLGKLAPPRWHTVITEKRATFACVPGLRRPAAICPLPRLYLAGDYVASDYPATLEAAVRSGVRCAELVMQDLAGLVPASRERNQ